MRSTYEWTSASGQPVVEEATMNWSGTHLVAAAASVRRPRSLDELRELLATADRRIHVLGNRFSAPALLHDPDSLALDMGHFQGIVRTTATTVVVLGSTSIATVHTHLKAIGRRIDCSPPVIAEQTMAGAIGTGTHGQGIAQSTIGDAVQSIWVMGSNGRIQRITRQHDAFAAHIMHLGVLGIVVLVELRTVPNRIYLCDKIVLDHADFLREFPRLNATHEFCKAWWFPQHRKAHVWMLRPATPPEHPAHESRGIRPGTDHGLDAMNEIVDDLVERLKIDTRTNDLRQSQFQTVQRFRDATTVRGDLYDLLCKGIPVPQINCEIGIPLEAFTEALTQLTRWYERDAPTMHYPLILRATGPSKAWLSAAYSRPTLHFGTVVYQASDGSHEAGALASMQSIQGILSAYDGKPHLGKYFDPAVFPLHKDECVERFIAVRVRQDPQRRFANEYIDRILCDTDGLAGPGSEGMLGSD